MRIIKFRGKRLDNQEWIEGDLAQAEGRAAIVPQTICAHDYTNTEVDPITIGQFTGLVDKNGKEIYEGDIVRDYIGNCIYVFKFGTISHTVKSKLTDQLNDVTFTGFYVDIPKIGTELLLWSSVKESEIEVIGNFHENPELL